MEGSQGKEAKPDSKEKGKEGGKDKSGKEKDKGMKNCVVFLVLCGI